MLSQPLTLISVGTIRSNIPNMPKGTYTFSFDLSSTGGDQVTARKIVNGVTTQITYAYNTKKLTFTLDEYATLQLEIYRSGLQLSEISNAQLEKDSTASTYEAYQSQSYPINLQGKNLLDLSQKVIGIAWNNATSADRAVVYIPCKPSTKYTVSINSLGNIAELWYFEKANKTDDTKTDGNYQVTTTLTRITNASSNYIGLQFNKTSIASSDFTNVKVMVEEESYATPYEDFWEYNLCKIGNYQDYLYNVGSKWYKHNAIKKITINGNESWVQNSTYTKVYYIENFLTDATTEPRPMLSDYFTYGGLIISGSGSVENGKFYQWPDMPQRLILGYDTTSLSTFTTWLKTHNADVYYPLATPIEEEITEQSLLNQLNNIQALAKSYYGTTNIIVTTENEQPTLKVQTLGKIGG